MPTSNVALHEEQIPREADPDSGLPIGPLLNRPEPAKAPERTVLEGHYCRLEPLDPKRHCGELYAASTPANAAALFQYLGEQHPDSPEALREWAEAAATSNDPLFFAVIDKRSGKVQGRQTLMRITPASQCIEIGNVYWGPAIAGTPVATEANYLFARYVFDTLGYRRYEWKCNALNAPSRKAALRFGFQYEGHFRRATIVRGRTRDTSWFAMVDEDWTKLAPAYEQWLDPDNFDSNRQQKTRLSELTASALSK